MKLYLKSTNPPSGFGIKQFRTSLAQTDRTPNSPTRSQTFALKQPQTLAKMQISLSTNSFLFLGMLAGIW